MLTPLLSNFHAPKPVTYIKTGDVENGKQLLIQVIQKNPRDENAWLWMSQCVKTAEKKRECFERVLKINPQNHHAIEGLRRLDAAKNNSVAHHSLQSSTSQLRVKKSSKNFLIVAGIVGLALTLVCALFIVSVNPFSKLQALPAFTPSFTYTPVPTDTLAPTLTFEPTFTSTITRTPTIIQTSTITPIPILGIGSSWISPKNGMIMVYVPEGDFLMGSLDSSESANDDEKPQHTVYLDAFWIGKTEVTNAEYTKCVQAGACQPPTIDSLSGLFIPSGYLANPQYSNFPVVAVSWNDAEAYCSWADLRLPSEAEWEKASRGTDGRKYPWGDSDPSCSLGNFQSFNKENFTYVNCKGAPMSVGSYPQGASPYGALDMSGNVAEWVADWFSDSYYGQSSQANPTGPMSGENRTYRGGGWRTDVFSSTTTFRYYQPADAHPVEFGFRCARSSK